MLLQVLSLASNELTSLPTALWERSALQKLDLSNNQLTEIPAEILKLQQLQVGWCASLACPPWKIHRV